MAERTWNAAANRRRLIGGAEAMAEGLISTHPTLGPFEAELVKALADYESIVGSHAAGCASGPEPEAAQDGHGEAQPEPFDLGFTMDGAVEWGIVG